MSQDFSQITIPTFDDVDDYSAPVPFGRPSFGGQGFGAGRESPIPMMERDRHGFHARDDSITSEGSTHSFRFAGMPQAPTKVPIAAHQPSASSPSNFSMPSRKSSFASLRNAFKSTKSTNEPKAPPVPPIDHQAYPALKDPFKRAQLAQSQAAAAIPSARRPSVVNSPQISGSPSSQPGLPQHSRALSRNNSPYVFGRPSQPESDGVVSTPPPVPTVPHGLRHAPSISADYQQPSNSPAEYALSVIFVQFVTTTDALIDAVLRQDIDDDPFLPNILGPGKDAAFDSLLDSLARIAQKHTVWVMNSILRWKGTQNEGVSQATVRRHTSLSPHPGGKLNRFRDIESMLNERKSHTAIYIMCRALIAILRPLTKDTLGDGMGNNLEDTTFEQFRNPDLKSLARSANHRACVDLYAILLGQLSGIRFLSVTDRFLSALAPLAAGKVLKDDDSRFENLVKGLSYIQIKVWPPEAFEDGADFLQGLSGAFANAHGLRLKTVFAEVLVKLLHPMGKTAQAEVNHPVWAKAIEGIFPKAKDMMTKPRYWHVAYPLVVISLCLGPQDLFLRNWQWCFEAGVSKLKDKSFRVPILNGVVRLLWTYLYRCNEPPPTVASKLDTILKVFFPTHRLGVHPNDEPLDAFIYILHFILSRHFEYGREVALEFLQEASIMAAGATVVPSEVLAPERMIIALRAILLTLDVMEKDRKPSWPTSCDFSSFIFGDEYPFTANFLPSTFLSKPGIQEFFDRCGPIVSRITSICFGAVGTMSTFDQQYVVDASTIINSEERENIVIKFQGGTTVGYSRALVPTIDLLFTCFESWPRCLHPSLPLPDALDMLIRGVIHIEGTIAEAASAALKRFAVDDRYSSAVVLRYTKFLFSSKRIQQEGFGPKLMLETPSLLQLWAQLVGDWTDQTLARAAKDGLVGDIVLGSDIGVKIPLISMLDDVEAGALFLLSSTTQPVRLLGAKVLRLLNSLVPVVPLDPDADPKTSKQQSWVLSVLIEKPIPDILQDRHHILDTSHRLRLAQWRELPHPDVILRLAESDSIPDNRLWEFIFPYLIRACHIYEPRMLTIFRESVVAAALRFHPFMSSIAGISGKLPSVQGTRSPPIQVRKDRDKDKDISEHVPAIKQWHIWVACLCATAVEPDPPMGEAPQPHHSRGASDVTNNRQKQIVTTGGLFAHIIAFLASDFGPVRTAAVLALACIQKPAYQILLDKMQSITRHIYDITKQSVTKPIYQRSRSQDRLHTSVAQVYQLTAHFVQDPKLLGDQKTLRFLLQFVRETQVFLITTEASVDWELQPLRKYFCGVLEHLFEGLSTLPDSDRFLGANMRLVLYRLCEEWCQYGPVADLARQRNLAMNAGASMATTDPHDKEKIMEAFRLESIALSAAAAGAMAALCQGAFFAPEVESTSPSDSGHGIVTEASDVTFTLLKITAMLASDSLTVRTSGKRALRSLLLIPSRHDTLIDTAISFSYSTSRGPDSAKSRFFDVVAEIIMTAKDHSFSFAQMICLCLSNLCHPQHQTRQKAFEVVEFIHATLSGAISLAPFEAAVGSQSASIYLPAQRQISAVLAKTHPSHGASILAQWTLRIPQVYDDLPLESQGFHLHLLASLEPWIGSITLMPDGHSELSNEGNRALYNLTALTIRYGDGHPDQVQALWARLVSTSFANVNATVKFLIEQATRRGNPKFFVQAKRIIAHLSRTPVGRRTFIELCTVIEPAAMLPAQEINPSLPDLKEGYFTADLDVLLPLDEPRMILGTGQLALLFLCDLALERAWELGEQLPVLLQALFSHLDHRVPFLQQHAQRFLFQILRSWTPGYEELPVQILLPSRSEVRERIERLAEQGKGLFWSEGSSDSQADAKMDSLCGTVLALLTPLYPQLRQQWGELALHWGTSCPIRPIAFRSLQLFRVLMPKIDKGTLALMLGRLSNTLAHPDENIQSFTREIILTLTSLTKSDLDVLLLPQLFWSACACLSTTIEKEFISVLDLLNALLDRLNFNDEATVDRLITHKPSNWVGSDPSLECLVLVGLRSSVTSNATMTLLKRLATLSSSALIDSNGGRVRNFYAISLPWCLHAMDGELEDETLNSFALDIARLADLEGRNNISRIMTSFAKRHFRTRGDFLQQAVRCLRESFGVMDPTYTVKHLLGLVLNRQRWLRIKSMEILKVLFQHRETRTPLHGSDLLMPLLRILSTDLAPQALEVLEEPLSIAGGPSAAQVLRMSMSVFSAKQKDQDGAGAVAFGVPEESGWCIARPEEVSQMCRRNVMAVYDTCKVSSRPSMVVFEPEIVIHESETMGMNFPKENPTSLGDLVSTLYDLNTYYQYEEDDRLATPGTALRESTLLYSPIVDTEITQHKVAAILSRVVKPSTNGVSRAHSLSGVDWNRHHRGSRVPAGFNGQRENDDSPPTPFIGLFSISRPETTSLIGGPALLKTRSHESDFERPRPVRNYPGSPPLEKDMATLNQNFLAYSEGEESDSLEGHIGIALGDLEGEANIYDGQGRANSIAYTESVYSNPTSRRGSTYPNGSLQSSPSFKMDGGSVQLSPSRNKTRPTNKLRRKASSRITPTTAESSDSEDGVNSFTLDDPFISDQPHKTMSRKIDKMKEFLGSPSLLSPKQSRSPP